MKKIMALSGAVLLIGAFTAGAASAQEVIQSRRKLNALARARIHGMRNECVRISHSNGTESRQHRCSPGDGLLKEIQ